MASGIYIALSGAVAQNNALDVVANNVANAGATGFRADRMSFQKVLGKASGKDTNFVQVAVTRVDSQQGTIRQTGNPLDLSLAGDGFFAIDTPRGTRYTRAGDFTLDKTGKIVNPDGYTAKAQGGGSIAIPQEATEITVDREGSVYADGNRVGGLQLARFAPGNVVHEGGALFAAAPGATSQIGQMPEVQSGSIEEGNFSVVRGMVDLIKVSRSYDALHRMLESYKAIDQRTAQSIGTGR